MVGSMVIYEGPLPIYPVFTPGRHYNNFSKYTSVISFSSYKFDSMIQYGSMFMGR